MESLDKCLHRQQALDKVLTNVTVFRLEAQIPSASHQMLAFSVFINLKSYLRG